MGQSQRKHDQGHDARPTRPHPLEEATLRAFVPAPKRDRLLSLLASPKRRGESLDTLNHFSHWDARFAHPVDSSTDVLGLLRNAGAPRNCHVISNALELDGREMPLAEALRACEAYAFASVLCCLPGSLAFYFDELWTPRNRILLRRTGGTP